MKVSQLSVASLLSAALVLMAVSVGSVTAQVKIKPFAVVQQPDETLVEKINQMSAQIKALDARVASDEQHIHEIADMATKAGYSSTTLSGKVDALSEQVTAQQASASKALDTLSSTQDSTIDTLYKLRDKFSTHTHSYNSMVLKPNGDNSVTFQGYTNLHTGTPSD